MLSRRMRVVCPRVFRSKPIAMRSFIKSFRLLLVLSLMICPSIANGQMSDFSNLGLSYSDHKSLREGRRLIVDPDLCGYDDPGWGAWVFLGPVTVTPSGNLEISFSYEPKVKFDDGKVAVDAARWKTRRNVTVNVIIEGREHGESIREELTFEAPISEVKSHFNEFFSEDFFHTDFLEIKGKLCSDKFTTSRESGKKEIEKIGAARYLAKRLAEAKVEKFCIYESDSRGFFNLETISFKVFKDFFLLYYPELLESPKRMSRTSASGKSVPNTTGWAFLNDVAIKEIVPTKCGGRDTFLVFTGIEDSNDVYKVYLIDADIKDGNSNHRPPEVRGMIYHDLGENEFLGLKLLDRLYPENMAGFMYSEMRMDIEKDAQYIIDFATNDTRWIDKTGITFEETDRTEVYVPDKIQMKLNNYYQMRGQNN